MTRWSSLLLIVLLIIAPGCKQEQPQGETLFRGEASIACDQEVAQLIVPQLDSFVLYHEGAHIKLEATTALEAMRQLLSGRVRAAIVARDYLPQEDSLLRAYSIEPHKRFLIATDALVFVTAGQTALDTASDEIVRSTLRGERTWLAKYRWSVPNASSSLAAHLRTIAGGAVRMAALAVPTGDSTIAVVRQGKSDIGVALLSQYLRQKAAEPSLRALRIVIRDTATGDRIAVAPHAATIVKETYPYRVPIYGYLLETARNFPYGVIASIAQEPRPQRAMLNAGIVPGYAKIQLVEPD
ncbi:hypothetical protein HRbin20_00076 [bacterium HR20]|nr:hypothetical protein HRbin20_00076 [bacterium HR20]